MHYYHSASAELDPECLFGRRIGAERAVVGRTVAEQIAEFERVALVVWAAAVAAAVEGLVVVDQMAALVVAAVVPVDWAEVAVAVAVVGCFPAAAAFEHSLVVAAVDSFPAAAVVK